MCYRVIRKFSVFVLLVISIFLRMKTVDIFYFGTLKIHRPFTSGSGISTKEGENERITSDSGYCRLGVGLI